MKKLLVFTLLLALVLLPALAQADKSQKPATDDSGEKPLGSKGKGTLMTDHFSVVSPEAKARAAAKAEQDRTPPPFPLADTFLLHSLPSSPYKLFLDFDGHRGGYKAYDLDGDSTTYNAEERGDIQKMWYLVSEDFLPFTIDVTTEDPGPGFPGMRAVVDGSARYSYGWAYVNSWPDSDNFAYAGFWDGLWNWIATAVSHEVGHTLGCSDHGGGGDGGYYMGHGTGATHWAPIMGWDSDALGVWDDANYPSPNHSQDSLALIDNSAGVDYRADDHGNSIGTATPITLPATMDFAAEGIIEQNSDVDYFEFTTSGGNVQISINEDVRLEFSQSNLDVLAKIHDDTGAVIHTSNPLWDVYASFDVNLSAGTYYLSIDGTGLDHPDGEPWEGYGYSDYGILGYYSIRASDGSVTTVTVPDVTGQAQATAEANIVAAGLTVGTVTTASSQTVPAGDVISQDPTGGSTAPVGSAVDLVVSTGPGGGCTPTDMHIDNVVCSEVGCGGPNKQGRATVTIVDDCGNPVAGALVDVTFSGDISETINNVATDANGIAVLTTSSCVKRPNFTVTVTDVTGALPYDSNDDVTNSCSG